MQKKTNKNLKENKRKQKKTKQTANAIPGTLVCMVKFVDYFSVAETPISKLQKHFSTYSSKKNSKRCFRACARFG